jgi:hypothetical protein
MYLIFVEIIGWIGSVLIVGAFALNALNKVSSSSALYRWSNLVGGICFIINTFEHKAYPSVFVNVVWVIIAVIAISKAKKE